MAFQKTPSYLWQHSSGLWYLKRPIPPDLQSHYKAPSGKPRGHLVESLGTHSRTEAEQRKRPRLRQIEAEFAALARGYAPQPQGSSISTFREAMAAVADHEDNSFAVHDVAQAAAEAMEPKVGPAAAKRFYRAATSPGRVTLKEALEDRHNVATLRNQTKVAEEAALRDLLAFLKVDDCLPEDVTDADAQAFVDLLNASGKSFKTKKGKLSCLSRLWGARKFRQQLTKEQQALWSGHELSGQRKSTEAPKDDALRPWTDSELVTLFTAAEPEDKRKRTYTRALFCELYALGLLTGMRLDEITARTRDDVQEVDGGVVLSIRAAKSKAGIRDIPVVHPVAVSILKRRAAAQTGPKGRLFAECAEGGYDSKTSQHVQKALTNERKRLKLNKGTDFHSTRRNFMTLLENAGVDSVWAFRYVGHEVPSLFHKTYSGGATLETLRKVAEVVRYSPNVEAVLARANMTAN